MLATRTLEVPLPECVVLNDVDLELLKASFQALVALRCEKGREWEGLLWQLKEDGWTVRWGLIHISEPTRLGMISYAVFCLKKKKTKQSYRKKKKTTNQATAVSDTHMI